MKHFRKKGFSALDFLTLRLAVSFAEDTQDTHSDKGADSYTDKKMLYPSRLFTAAPLGTMQPNGEAGGSM